MRAPSIFLSQKLAAEALGTAFLLATIVGSGMMAERLAGGNIALALLCNTIPTGAILVVLITMFGPISGAHFNPVVTMIFWLKKALTTRDAVAFIGVQIIAGVIGVWVVHVMFDVDILQFSLKQRTGFSQFFAEIIATFGLIVVILATLKSRGDMVAVNVGLYITAAYWFTASTSFANPAVTIARSFSDSFAGIAPEDMPLFILAQCIGAWCALVLSNWLFSSKIET